MLHQQVLVRFDHSRCVHLRARAVSGDALVQTPSTNHDVQPFGANHRGALSAAASAMPFAEETAATGHGP